MNAFLKVTGDLDSLYVSFDWSIFQFSGERDAFLIFWSGLSLIRWISDWWAAERRDSYFSAGTSRRLRLHPGYFFLGGEYGAATGLDDPQDTVMSGSGCDSDEVVYLDGDGIPGDGWYNFPEFPLLDKWSQPFIITLNSLKKWVLRLFDASWVKRVSHMVSSSVDGMIYAALSVFVLITEGFIAGILPWVTVCSLTFLTHVVINYWVKLFSDLGPLFLWVSCPCLVYRLRLVSKVGLFW